MVLIIKAFKAAAVQRLSDFAGQIIVKIEIVHHGKPHAERFLRFYQMSDISAAVIPTRRAAA